MSEVKGECVAILEGHNGSVYSVSWTPGKQDNTKMEEDGQQRLGWLASAGGDGSVFIWEIIVGLSSTNSSYLLIL